MSRNTDRLAPHTFNATRRRLLRGAALGAATLAAPMLARAQPGPVIRIGYWPVAAGLPFYAAIEKGYFKEAGLNVEALVRGRAASHGSHAGGPRRRQCQRHWLG